MKTNSHRDERPIVCGTDFSTTAVEAVDIAAGIARKLGTRLILVHVEEFQGLAAVDPTSFETALSQRRSELKSEAERLRQAGTEVKEKLLSGPPFDQLVATASQSKAGLLIVGAVGHALARRILLGSVAERTAENSPVPTIVVRPGSRIASWVRGEHPLKVLVGYDFSPAGDNALRWLSQMQSIGPCDITVLHIDWPPAEARRIGYQGPLPLTENPEAIQKLLERELAEQIATLLPTGNVSARVAAGWGHPEGILYETASREHADLVVVGTHHRQGLGRVRFGSVSRTVLHHANASVAVIPAQQERGRSPAPGKAAGANPAALAGTHA